MTQLPNIPNIPNLPNIPKSGSPPATSSGPGTGTGPVGTGEYVVKPGDCISSLARDNGLFWKTIWDDPKNAEVKSTRKDPNVLFPGDRIHIPALRKKQEAGQTEMRHRFVRKGEPAKLHLRVVKQPDDKKQVEKRPELRESTTGNSYMGGDPAYVPKPQEDEPRANVPYTLTIDGEHYQGSTDADGRIEMSIPSNARQGQLILNPGTEDEEKVQLQLGHLNPVTEVSGIKGRLQNLHLFFGTINDEETAELDTALRAFQAKHGLTLTGKADTATQQKLEEVHGS